MFEVVKKSLLAGIGLASMGKEKAEELVTQVCQQADVSKEEGERWLKEIREMSEAARQDMQDRVTSLLREQLEKLDVPSKQDIAQLAARVEELERKLEMKS
ncbi:MAG: phasin family protein [Nitrospinaceae bacterium]